MASEKFYPTERSVGQECEFWQGVRRDQSKMMGYFALGCMYPKLEVEGRLSCEGIVDDVCIYLLKGQRMNTLDRNKIEAIRSRGQNARNRDLPPGSARSN